MSSQLMLLRLDFHWMLYYGLISVIHDQWTILSSNANASFFRTDLVLSVKRCNLLLASLFHRLGSINYKTNQILDCNVSLLA